MKITYENEVLDAYSGQINCEAGIFVDGEIVGVAQYVLYDDELTISDIFVRPEFRRQGFGSRLMKYIKQQNPDHHYKPSMKTELGAKFVHKELGLDEGLSDILKGKDPKESWANLPYIVRDFYEKLKKEFPNAKFLWQAPKVPIKQKYGIFKIFFQRRVFYISYDMHWSGMKVFKVLVRDPESKGFMIISADIINFDQFMKLMKQIEKENNEPEEYGDVPADYVKESLADVLKPKDPEHIMSIIKEKFNPYQLQTEFLTYPYIDEYFKDFYFEKDLWVKDPKWSKYAQQHNPLQSRTMPPNYQTIDITKEAKERILESTQNIKSKRPIRALQFNWASWGNLDSIQRFMRELNIINGVNSIEENPKWKHFGDNDAFKWAYYGEDYSFVGNSDGFALFLVPDDFIKRFFGVNESILAPKSQKEIDNAIEKMIRSGKLLSWEERTKCWIKGNKQQREYLEKHYPDLKPFKIGITGVRESISDILKPKSIEDIKRSVIELVENLEETQNAAEFIDQTEEEDPDVCAELRDVCAAMGSDPGDVEFIIEDSTGYEEIKSITNIIDEKSHSQQNSIARAEHPLTYENSSYRINPVAKIAWMYPNDFNGMNAIFFNYPHLLKTIKKVELAWEKYQI